jgi:hypothetical protein
MSYGTKKGELVSGAKRASDSVQRQRAKLRFKSAVATESTMEKWVHLKKIVGVYPFFRDPWRPVPDLA